MGELGQVRAQKLNQELNGVVRDHEETQGELLTTVVETTGVKSPGVSLERGPGRRTKGTGSVVVCCLFAAAVKSTLFRR